MRYVTVKEMKELDRCAINQYGILASFLMENAGKAIAAEAMKTVRKGKVFIQLPAPGLVIDAIFGIGIRGVLDEFFLKLIDRINGFGCPVIAADVPSGLDADTGKSLGAVVKAWKTITLGYPKIGFQNPAAKPYLGEVVCVDIGLPALELP